MTFIDLMGQRFGRLTVIANAGVKRYPSGQTKRRWLCACDCGGDVVVDSQPLRIGQTNSCGCLRRENALGRNDSVTIGRRFGRWTVLAREGAAPTGAATFRCVCDCGTERLAIGSRLRGGLSQSCGCLAIERATAAKIKPVVKYLSMHDRIRNSRGRAKQHNCVDCAGRAREWSYNGGDPAELTEVIRGTPLKYSLDVARYSPRCKPCHARYDGAQRRAAA